MPRVWRFTPHDESRIRSLCAELRVAPLTAQVLISRGFTAGADAREFLDAKLAALYEPNLLPGVSQAADAIVAAIAAGRRITIYGDYDVDGVTATALLWHCLKIAGANVDYYIPSRLEEGYGLNCEALTSLHQEDPARLVISVDCGICSVEEARLARTLGLDLIITDHHQMDAELPDAVCLVHPRLPGGTYPFGELCGVGVAFKLAWAVCQRLGDGKKASPRMRTFLQSAVALAAIGTIADVVPLRGENRIIVRYGLGALAEQASIGLQALMRIAEIDKQRALGVEDISFSIAPRINAAGRLGQARLAVELLTTTDPARADALASYVDQLNKNRRAVERRMFKEAKELVEEHPEWADAPALVLAHHEWHVGVIGVVASRVVEHFEKPAILIALNHETNIGRGSGRTCQGFNLHAGLTHCAEHLQVFGGHEAAAGLTIAADRIAGFREQFCAFAAEHRHSGDELRGLPIDAEVRLADVTHRAVTELDRLGPFGQENPKPVFAATGVELAEPPRTMGDGQRHLSLKVRQFGKTLRAVAFGRGEWAEELSAQKGPLSICFAPNINRFRGREDVELQLIDWQAGDGAAT